MKPIQEVPGAKVVAIETAGEKRYVLCYSASMGYYIAASIKAEDVVICTANRARRMADAIGATSQIFFINESGNEELVTIHGEQVVDMNMMFPEVKTDEKKVQLAHRFINRDGNFLRFASTKGYYIDANGPEFHIVTFAMRHDADDFLMYKMRQNNTFKDLNGEFVDSNLTIHVSELA